jgi:hypothetical protein
MIRAHAVDDSVIINHIDSEILTYYFNPHWTVDWDVATIIQALEELYPLRQEHRHLDRGSRWLQVVDDSRARARIQAENMDQVRRDTINEWNSADANVGSIPYLQVHEVLKDLARCFTNKSNQWHNDKPNVHFQRYLNLMIEADREYLDNLTLSRLCATVADLIHRWKRLTHESSRMTDDSVKVAIAGCTIATHAACQIIQTPSRQAYGPVALRIGQFAFNVVFVSLHNDDRIDLLKRKAYEPEFDALSKRMRSFANP